MLSLRRSEVPPYLRHSEFYRALSEEDDELISVPAANIKLDTTVRNGDEVVHLLSTMRYWGVSDIIPDLVKYFIAGSKEITPVSESTVRSFTRDFPYLETLQTLQRDSSPTKRMVAAISSGMVDIVRHLVELGYSFPDIACSIAVEGGHLNMLRYLREDAKCRCSVSTTAAAAYRGKIDCLKYLLDGGLVDSTVSIAAVSNGNFECLRCAHVHGCGLPRTIVSTAIIASAYDCFVYCHVNGCVWPPTTLRDCVKYGRTDMFIYAMEHGCVLTPTLAHFCAAEGRLDMFIYAHERGMPVTADVLTAAAAEGHLDIIMYGRQHGCGWDGLVCYTAAHGGHLCCLEYAVQNGCPYDLRTLQDAARESGSVEVVLYAKKLQEYAGSGEV
jgi:hypothetical protein